MVSLSKYGDENDVDDSSEEEYVPPLCLRYILFIVYDFKTKKILIYFTLEK